MECVRHLAFILYPPARLLDGHPRSRYCASEKCLVLCDTRSLHCSIHPSHLFTQRHCTTLNTRTILPSIQTAHLPVIHHAASISSMRYRPSDRALKRSGRHSLRSPHHPRRRSQQNIIRRFEVLQESVSPSQPLQRASCRRAVPDRAAQSSRSKIKNMISNRSLSTASSTACEYEEEEEMQDRHPTVLPKLPPFQQSKHWPGKRRIPREEPRPDETTAPQDSIVQPQGAPATLHVSITSPRQTRENGTILSPTSDAASLASGVQTCGLPAMSALLGNRRSIKANVAVRRWLSKATFGRAEKGGEGKQSEKSAIPLHRRFKSTFSLRRSKSLPKTPSRLREIARAKYKMVRSRSSPGLAKDTSPRALSVRLSRSLIPNGDTCEFAREMNKEYPRLFRRGSQSPTREAAMTDTGSAAPKTGAETNVAQPGNLEDHLDGKNGPTIKRVPTRNERRPTIPETALKSEPEPNTLDKDSLSPPPRISSRMGTDPDLLSVSSLSSSAKTSAFQSLRTGRGLKTKTGSFNLRSHKYSVGLPSHPSPHVRPVASTDTLSKIEAQAEGHRKTSIPPENTSSAPTVTTTRTNQSPGNPPERPLPDLPSGLEQERQAAGSRASRRSQRLSRESGRQSTALMLSRSDSKAGAADELTPLPLIPISSPRRSTDMVSSGRRFIHPDPPSPTSVYSQESEVSLHAFTRGARTSDIGRSRKVRVLKRRDLIRRKDLGGHASISEGDEDEEGFTDIAEKFPPAPALGRSSSHGRSGRGHVRQRSTGNLRSRRRATAARPAKPPQTLGPSHIMVIADTNPLTSTFRAGASSPAPSTVSVKRASQLRRSEKSQPNIDNKQTMRNLRQAKSQSLPLLSGPVTMPQTPPSTASSGSSTGSKSDAEADVDDDGTVKRISELASPIRQRNMAANPQRLPALSSTIEPNLPRRQGVAQQSLPHVQKPNTATDGTSGTHKHTPSLEMGLKSRLHFEQVSEYMDYLEKALERRDGQSQYRAGQLEQDNYHLRRRVALLEKKLTIHGQNGHRRAMMEDRDEEIQYRDGERLLSGPSVRERLARPLSLVSRNSAHSQTTLLSPTMMNGGDWSENRVVSIGSPVRSSQGLPFTPQIQGDPFNGMDESSRRQSSVSNYSLGAGVPSMDSERMDNIISTMVRHWGSLDTTAVPSPNDVDSTAEVDYTRPRPTHRYAHSLASAPPPRRYSHRMSSGFLPASLTYFPTAHPQAPNRNSGLHVAPGRISEEIEPDSPMSRSHGAVRSPRASLERDEISRRVKQDLAAVRGAPLRMETGGGVELRVAAFESGEANVRRARHGVSFSR